MPERQCVGCKKQEEWGCIAERIRTLAPGEHDAPSNWLHPAQQAIKVDGEYTYACPRQPLKEEPVFWKTLLTYYSMFQKGFLPDDGGISQQSSRTMTLFEILASANAECDKTLAERETAKQNRGRGKRR